MKYFRSLSTGTAFAVACLLLTSITRSPILAADAAAEKPAEPAKKQEPSPAQPEKPKPATSAKEPAKAEDKKAESAEPKKDDKKGADDKTDAKEAASDQAPATHTVKAGLFELSVELEGTLESTRATAIAVKPESWSDLTVVETVEHGQMVKKGDVLVKLDTENLEEQIEDLQLNRPGAELALKLAEEEFAALEKNTPIALNDARKAKTRAEEDFEYYQNVTHPRTLDNDQWNVASAEFNVEYNQEELDQLRKMYAADDLTEETEEIIVKRTEFSVESARRSLDSTRERAERSSTTTLPREMADQRQLVEQARINWQKAEATLPEALKKARLDLAAQRRALKKTAKSLEELEKDLAAMTIVAPHDGIVYFGDSVRGNWPNSANIEKKLRPSGKLMPNEIFITLVQRAPLQIRAAVAENQLAHLAPGQKAEVTPTSSPDSELTAELASLSYVPLAGNVFDAVFSMPKQPLANLHPGMTAKLKIEIHKNDKALTVPKSAVKKDADGTHAVLADGSKRKIKTGKSNDKMTEILSGLKEGDVVKTK